MAHKKKHTGPVPPANQPKSGPGATPARHEAQPDEVAPPGMPGQAQDPKRRLGDYEGAGEHSIEQPGGKNDANH